MDKAQLLPCPFCGGQDVHHLTPDGPEGDRMYDSVICNTCGATCNNIDTQPELECLVAWNRRPQPPSASGEREAFVKWLSGTYPDIYSVEDAERLWSHEHISALAWQAHAALDPSPGIDAAEQKPIPLQVIRNWPAGLEDAVGVTMLDTVGYTLNYRLYDLQQALSKFGFTMTVTEAAPPAAQPSAEWMAEAERLVDEYAKEFAEGGATYARDIRRAALLAHLRGPHAAT